MTSSRNISDLHPVVARGCRELIKRMEAADFPAVGISATFRCHDEQNRLYAQGRTTPGSIVTNARGGQSWHNWRLAFDIFQNIRGQEWNNPRFFETAGKIWEQIGGEWGGSWTQLVDRPHFQFTNGATIAQMQAGHEIPEDAVMPWEALPKEVNKMAYKTVKEMPDWARPGIQQLIDLRVLNGRTPENLDVDENMMRILLIVRNMFDRAGLLESMACDTM
ncbi:MAG: M15 family metallopeptidase [Defluviitaleaceae bacterium]|nr:M15 family metallopeptidase [Defluviitaleaceae bacterium]